MMTAVVDDHTKKRKNSGNVFRQIFSKFSKSPPPPMLTTDAVPINAQSASPSSNSAVCVIERRDLQNANNNNLRPQQNGLLLPTNNHLVQNQNLQTIQQQVNLNFTGSKDVHVGNVIHVAAQAEKPKEAKKPKKKLSKHEIADLWNSDDQLDFPLMDALASHLKDWKNFYRKLGFSDGEIETALQNNPDDKKEAKYQLLLSWKQDQDEKATLGTLVKHLWEHKNYQCIDRLREEYEKRKKSNGQ